MFTELRIMLAKRKEYRLNALMSPEQFMQMKLVKFRALARHAYAKAPYYTELMDEHGIDPETCVPAQFPPLTKALLMQNFDRIITDLRVNKQGIDEFLSQSKNPADKYRDTFRVIHTSGSSGEPGYFVYSPEDWARGMSLSMRPRPQRPAAKVNRSKGGRFRIAFYGAVGGHYAAVTMMSAMQRGIGRFLINIGLFEVNNPLADTVGQLNQFQPDVLSGYTGALILLAREQQKGTLQISPRAIATAGEGMSATDKAVLEMAFGCEAANGYGSSEHLVMGGAHPDNATTMLLYDDELIYEPAEDHTLVTNLFNYTLPLIRYRMADILRPVARKTNPALPYLEVEAVVGRTENMPVFTNEHGGEDGINPITIVEIFVAGVQRFQMHWLDESSFDFLVCLDPVLTQAQQAEALDGVTRRLHEILAQKHLRNVRFNVLPVADIPVNPKTRKFQLILDCRSRATPSPPTAAPIATLVG